MASSSSFLTPETSHKHVISWLHISMLSIVIMVVIGGITRLTDSGLSMTEWRPLMGFIPPLSAEEWLRIFNLYKQTSEFTLQNSHIDIEGFKTIFWWEYIHRIWGRIIGLIYGGGLIYFLIKRQLPQGYYKHFFMLLALGGLQGLIGWWMVRSGFADRVDVSAVRLMVHLGLAFFIIGYIYILTKAIRNNTHVFYGFLIYNGATPIILVFVIITILSGALVAGSSAGYIYNTWPLMGDSLWPSDYNILSSWWHNAIENPAAIQAHHRMLAYISFAVIVWWRWHAAQYGNRQLCAALNMLLAMIVVQMGLGITTLLTYMHIVPAAIHQFGAILVLITALYAVWCARNNK